MIDHFCKLKETVEHFLKENFFRENESILGEIRQKVLCIMSPFRTINLPIMGGG